MRWILFFFFWIVSFFFIASDGLLKVSLIKFKRVLST